MSATNTPISQKEDDNNADQEPSERRVLVNWDKSPSLVKINIRMPLGNDSPASRRENQDPPELIPFWYDGFYYITAVRHNFSGGQFTQDITALSVISEDVFSSTLGAEGQEVANEPPTVDQNTQAEEVQQGAVTRASSGEIRTAQSAALRTKAALPPSGRRERG